MMNLGPMKKIRTKNYNYNFFYETGLFIRWGKNLEENPPFSPLGPEILDVEVSTICHGINGKPCSWCYKTNDPRGSNMSFETFKKIFHKIPKNLTQIAFGIGDIDSNPELFKMFEYCRKNDENEVVPNVTINGWNLTDKYADKLARFCGAVAISNYKKDITYNAVEKLAKRIGKNQNTLKQVNIHQLTALETFKDCITVTRDVKEDERLRGLNAIVFLALKQKGNRNTYHPLPLKKFREIVDYALSHKIAIGMDSCSAGKFLSCIKGHPHYKKFETLVEPCESGLFSLYINVYGRSYYCSFLEGEKGYSEFDVLNCTDFLKDVWYHPKMMIWRKKLLGTEKSNELKCRKCPQFRI
ncbi:MAG: radical SAM protein [Promethearchaeota archaeon]